MIDQSPPTPEERELTRGMPPNIAVGFIAARRAKAADIPIDIAGMYAQKERVADLEDEIRDALIDYGMKVSRHHEQT